MRLYEIISVLSKYDPELILTLKSDQGSATDKVGFLIYNLITKNDIFSNEQYTNVIITIKKTA